MYIFGEAQRQKGPPTHTTMEPNKKLTSKRFCRFQNILKMRKSIPAAYGYCLKKYTYLDNKLIAYACRFQDCDIFKWILSSVQFRTILPLLVLRLILLEMKNSYNKYTCNNSVLGKHMFGQFWSQMTCGGVIMKLNILRYIYTFLLVNIINVFARPCKVLV